MPANYPYAPTAQGLCDREVEVSQDRHPLHLLQDSTRVGNTTDNLEIAEPLHPLRNKLVVRDQSTTTSRPILAVGVRVDRIVQLGSYEKTSSTAVQALEVDGAAHGRDSADAKDLGRYKRP